MAYTDFAGKTILHSWGRFRATNGGTAVSVGDLVDQDFNPADATAGGKPARYIACEDIAASKEGWFALKAEIKKAATVSTGGAVTRGDHGGTAGDVLFLSTTAGDAVETPDGDGLGQVVGRVLSQDTVLLDPAEEYDELMELEDGNKTLDAEDVGKVFYVKKDAAAITLPATSVGLMFTIVNCGQDGDCKVSVSPNALDKIMGPDIAGTDNKDLINTKATAKCMDRVTVIAEGTNGYYVAAIRGVWAAEA